MWVANTRCLWILRKISVFIARNRPLKMDLNHRRSKTHPLHNPWIGPRVDVGTTCQRRTSSSRGKRSGKRSGKRRRKSREWEAMDPKRNQTTLIMKQPTSMKLHYSYIGIMMGILLCVCRNCGESNQSGFHGSWFCRG